MSGLAASKAASAVVPAFWKPAITMDGKHFTIKLSAFIFVFFLSEGEEEEEEEEEGTRQQVWRGVSSRQGGSGDERDISPSTNTS